MYASSTAFPPTDDIAPQLYRDANGALWTGREARGK